MTSFEQEKFTRSAFLKGGGALIVAISLPASALWPAAAKGAARNPADVACDNRPGRARFLARDSRRRTSNSIHWQDGSRSGKPDRPRADRRRGARCPVRERSDDHGRHDALGRPGPNGREPDDRSSRPSASAGGGERSSERCSIWRQRISAWQRTS